jgi:osmotically-inducible protein OsmY
MKSLKVFWLGFLALMIVGVLVGCEKMASRSPDVSDSIRKSLDQAGLKDVSVSQDRDKGVVTLGGHVAADASKSQAESIAKAIAAGQVVANQIAVTKTQQGQCTPISIPVSRRTWTPLSSKTDYTET